MEKKNYKRAIPVTVVLILLLTMLFSTAVFAKDFYPYNGGNNLKVIVKGPSGTSTLNIGFKCKAKNLTSHDRAWFKNDQQNIIISQKNVSSSNPYKVSVSTQTVKTTLDGGVLDKNGKVVPGSRGYSIVSFTASFSKPEHQVYSSSSVSGKGPGRLKCSYAASSHAAGAITMSFEINLSNIGLITDTNGDRNTDCTYTINLAKPSRTVTFNANGGNVSPASKNYACGDKFESVPTPTRTGYTFEGWYTDKTSGTKYDANSTTCANRTLYAHWSANKYNVIYNANGGTGSMGNTAVTYDTNVTLAKNAFSKQYYIFSGWATSASGSVAYKDGQQFKYTTAGNLTLYAKWSRSNEKVTVKFDPNGGTLATQEQSVLIGTNVTLPGDKVTRKWYTLVGWSTDPRSKDPEYGISDTITASNMTFYAIWKNANGNSDLANVITGDSMFKDDSNLEGDAGTTYNSLHDGLDYAHPDEGADNPGYYSEK